MSLYRIKMNGKIYEMEIELIEEGKKRPDKIEKKKPAKKEPEVAKKPAKEAASNTNAITSSMPGTVLEVLVKPGQKVDEDAVVLVLETMKMENEVLAPHAGSIKAVFVDEGQSVVSGTPLFEMED